MRIITTLASSGVVLLWSGAVLPSDAFSGVNNLLSTSYHQRTFFSKSSTTTSSSHDSSLFSTVSSLSPADIRKKERKALIRKEGGRFAFDTKYGALNPFAIYYGVTSIALGIPWFIALCIYQLFRVVTFNKLDPQRRIPIFFTHIWGTVLMRLTRCFPVIDNHDVLLEFYKQKRPALFVANHNSWMDIPFLGATIGWRNYKIISKKELGKVPILGKAIKVGGNIMVDRVDRRSQLRTLRQGIQYLKDGVHLCTYPEGTRTRTGRLTKFKNGAFKMAHKVEAPIIPISIVGAATVMPVHWMFPYRPARGVSKVVVHAPVESKGKTEQEVADAARASIIKGLPEDQKPEGE